MNQDSSPSARTAAPASTRPLVSVLIPTYNYGRYLPEALDSVLSQDYPNLEIIVSDDDSTDDTAAVLARYVARDARIRVTIQPQNLGMVPHWNWCLREARGTYVKMLFGDDRLSAPHAISTLVSLLESNPGACLATSARVLIDRDSRMTGIWNDLRSARTIDGRQAILTCLLQNRNLIGEPSAVLFRRNAMQRGFSPLLRQLVDLEMWFELLLRGDLVYTPEPLCAFRMHGAQQTVVNRSTEACYLEMAHVVSHYLELPAVRDHAGCTPHIRRQILFGTLHHLQKAARHQPKLLPIVAQWRRRLPWRWRLTCWCTHRLLRPFVNLQRSYQRRSDLAQVHRQVTSGQILPLQ